MIYEGFKDVVVQDDAELAAFYENPSQNVFDCYENEYVILHRPDDTVIDKLKWDGAAYKTLSFRQINDNYEGKIKPRNIHQELAFDLLQDKKTTVKALLGCFGSGKTMLMISTALQLIREGKYERIVYVRNNIEVKDSKPLGALPGTADEKLLPFAMPFADHVAGVEGVEHLCRLGQLEVTHLGFLRGRSIKNAILLASEAGNLTKDHVQLLLGRIDEGSALWLDGDLKQVDMAVFEKNSGLSTAIDKLKGNPLFGYVHLQKTERSPTAALADLLD